MAQNDIYKLTLHATYHGQNVQTGGHFRTEDAAGTPAGLAASFRDNVLDTLRAATVDEILYTRITSEQIAAGVPPSTIGPFVASSEVALAAATDGDLIGQGMVGQAPAVVKIGTGLKGRRFRGRMFISGAPEAESQNGLWSAAQQALWDAFAADLLANFGAGGAQIYTLGVWSPEDLTFKKKDGTPAPRVGNLFNPATAISVSNVVKTLRRRAVGVGR